MDHLSTFSFESQCDSADAQNNVGSTRFPRFSQCEWYRHLVVDIVLSIRILEVCSPYIFTNKKLGGIYSLLSTGFIFFSVSWKQSLMKPLLLQLGAQFVGNAVYTAVWIAAICLFMELLGFSTQKMLTAGGLGTVLLTLAGREVRNFTTSRDLKFDAQHNQTCQRT